MGQQPADISLEELKHLYYQESLSMDEVARRLGCSQAAVWRRMRKHKLPIRSKSEAGLLVNSSRAARRDFDATPQDKAYLIGFCKGDVHSWIRDKNSQTIRLVLATTQSEQVNLFTTLFAPYGHVYISKPDRRGAIHMGAYVNQSMAFLLDEKDEIPDWILASEETFFAFFAGYTDAEAHIGVHNGYAVYKLDTCDKNILFESHRMLMKAGISAPAPYVVAAQGYTNKNGHAYHNDMWRVIVRAKASLLTLFQYIAPHLKHAKRVGDMQIAIQNIETRNLKMRSGVAKEQ